MASFDATNVAQTRSDERAFDVDASVAAFRNDATLDCIELPEWLTVEQRKQARKAAEHQPELRYESLGFGAERRLHIFKNTGKVSVGEAPRAFSVKNTFIDDWIAVKSEADGTSESFALRSLPTPTLPKLTANIADTQFDPHRLDLSLILGDACQEGVDTVEALGSGPSTCPSVVDGFSSPRSPSVTSETPMQASIDAHVPENVLRVRNTFIHLDLVEEDPVDPRMVQSMPSGMFAQCLESEAVVATSNMTLHSPVSVSMPPVLATPSPTKRHAPLSRECLLAPGTSVIIEGLVKAPKFNGLSGVVESHDAECDRYNILLSASAGLGTTQLAKLKAENLRPRSPNAQFPTTAR